MEFLYNTDFLYNLFITNQSNHQKVKEIFAKIQNESITMLKLVKFELATVLSHKENQQIALEIIKKLDEMEINYIELSEEMENEVWKTFGSFAKKNISFVDCANLTIARKYKLKIASLDQFYPSEFLLD